MVARSSAITLRQLRAFIAVAEEGSIAKAAQRLSLTPSALSMLLSALEGELSTRLFERTTRRMVMTEAGRELLPGLRRMFTQLDDALQGLEALSERRSATLRVAASPLMAATLLPWAMAEFSVRHPLVRLSLIDESVAAVAQAVRRAEADLGICTADVDTLDLFARPLLRDRLELVCPPEHPLAEQREVDWKDLAGERVVLMKRGSGLRTLVEQGLRAVGTPVTAAFEVAHVATAVGLVEAGLAVAPLPSYALRRARATGVRAVPLVSPTVERAIVALHAPEHPLTAQAESFLLCVARAANGDSDAFDAATLPP